MAGWHLIGSVDDLQPDSGVCALVAGQQVAIFFMPRDNKVYAIQNYDPIGKANVISRGIVGDIKGEPVVASPLYKQHFNLVTGQCLEDENISLMVYDIRINDGKVEISLPGQIKTQAEHSSMSEEASL